MMTSKERILKSLNHIEADRVPIYIGGSASKFYISVAKKLIKKFSLDEKKLEKLQAGFKYVPFSEDLWRMLNIDVRYIYPGTESKELFDAQAKCGKYKNIWGSIFQYLDTDGERVNLESDIVFKTPDLKKLDNYKWPKPDKNYAKDLRKRAELLSDNGNFAIAIHRPLMGGVFSISRYCLRGSVGFFEDLILNKYFVGKLLDRVLEVQKDFYGVLLDEIGDLSDIIEIEDDLGAQTSLMISPKSYREIIKPKHKELVEFIKSKSPNIKVLMHCDGAIKDVISDFIEIGIDILNPIQVTASGMDLRDLKKEFGKDIVFAGGVNVIKLEEDIENVKNCVKETIDILAPGGGYLLGPSHNFSTLVSPENIITMVNTAKKYGKY